MGFWDNFETVDFCLLYAPLRIGCLLIALFGIVFGFIGFCYLLSLTALHAEEWQNYLYEEFDYHTQIAIFAVMTIVLVASIFLLIGVILESEVCVLIYLWLILFTLIVTWCILIAGFFYCGFTNLECFYKRGFIPVFVRHMYIGIGYSLFWGYLLLVANSYRLQI